MLAPAPSCDVIYVFTIFQELENHAINVLLERARVDILILEYVPRNNENLVWAAEIR